MSCVNSPNCLAPRSSTGVSSSVRKRSRASGLSAAIREPSIGRVRRLEVRQIGERQKPVEARIGDPRAVEPQHADE